MKTAGHNCVAIFLLICALGAGSSLPDKTKELLAQSSGKAEGTPGKVWLARVTRESDGPDPSVYTQIHQRRVGGTTWEEVTRVPARVVALAHRRSELAVLLDNGEWMFVWRGGMSTGARLPARGRMVCLAGDDATDTTTLWAIGEVAGGMPAATQATQAATRPTTATSLPAESNTQVRLVLFELEKGAWAPRSEIPVDKLSAVEDLSLLVTPDRVIIAAQSGNTIDAFQFAAGVVEDLDGVTVAGGVAEMKLLWESNAERAILWVAQQNGPDGICAVPKRVVTTRPTSATTQASEFPWPALEPLGKADPANAPRTVAVFSESLRLYFAKGARLFEQSYDNRHQAKGTEEVRQSSNMQDTRISVWLQVVTLVAVMFVVLGTMRRRAPTAEGEEAPAVELALAPLGRRFAGGVVDALPVIVTLMVVAIIAINANPDNPIQKATETPYALTILASCLVYLLHTTITELLWDRSVGKMIFGMKVVGIDGKQAARSAIASRNILRIVDLMMLFPLLMVIFSPLRQRAADIAAGTVVVEQ